MSIFFENSTGSSYLNNKKILLNPIQNKPNVKRSIEKNLWDKKRVDLFIDHAIKSLILSREND
jgi:hypothetical protein